MTTPPSATAASRRALVAVGACFTLSGFAALLYQTVWMRQFSTVFGTSELAVATVLASYMGGLALGSAVAARFVDRITRPVLFYGLLELGIAISALAVPLLMRVVRTIHVALHGGQPVPPGAPGTGQSLIDFAGAFIVLVLPTALMGATLPMLTRYAVEHRDQIGARVGLLYCLNTIGAVFGTLAAAFIILPLLGLQNTVVVGAAINGLVFLIVLRLAQQADPPNVESARSATSASPPPTDDMQDQPLAGQSTSSVPDGDVIPPAVLPVTSILALIAVSGAVSFIYEVIWTRLLGHILGASLYAFATMLAAFLTGIAIGSAIAARIASNAVRATAGFVVAQFITALMSIGIYSMLDTLADLAGRVGAGEQGGLSGNVVIAMSVLLPATLSIGATYPFAVRILARRAGDVGAASAHVYAWNTLGAIVGSGLAGFVLLPWLGFAGSVRLCVCANLALAVLACGLLPTPARKPSVAVAVGCFTVAVFFQPSFPEKVIRLSPLDGKPSDGRIVHYGVGKSATVALFEHDADYVLRTNGLPEATIRPQGFPPPGDDTEFGLGTLPFLIRPEATTMLIVGFGGGIAIQGVPPSVESIDVIELEPEVLDANRAVASVRLRDPLQDPRIRLIMNDARSALSLTGRRYDVIVSQPSHPWTAGASHLYTREFMEIARAHLRPGGLFVQWMQSEFVNAELFRTLGATVLDVFPRVNVYRPGRGMLLFLASDQTLTIDDSASSGGPLQRYPEFYEWFGVRSVHDVLPMLALDPDGLGTMCEGAPLSTDNHNRMATMSPQLLADPLGPAGLSEFLMSQDPIANHRHPMLTRPLTALDDIHVVHRLVSLDMPARAQRFVNKIPNDVPRLHAGAVLAHLTGDSQRSVDLVVKARQLAPDDPDLRWTQVEPWLPYLARKAAPAPVAQAHAELEGVRATVAQAAIHRELGQWSDLEAMDETLAQPEPMDLHYPLAVELRVAWRVLAAGDGHKRRLALDALRLLDPLIATKRHTTLLIYRIRAGLNADRPHLALESAWAVATALSMQGRAGNPAMRGLIAQLASDVLTLVELLPRDERLPANRVKRLRTVLRDMAN